MWSAVLDDPLSALDAEVGKDLFEQCILEGLGNKLVILITNQLSVVPKCDKVCGRRQRALTHARTRQRLHCRALPRPVLGLLLQVLVLEQVSQRGGGMVDFGTYAEIMERGLDFASMMERFGLAGKQTVAEDGSDAGSRSRRDSAVSTSLDRPRSRSMSSTGSGEHEPPAALMQKEEREVGAVPFSTYWKYIKSGGVGVFAFTMLMYLCAQMFGLAAPFVVSMWTNDPNYEKHTLGFYMLLYGLSGVGMGIFAFVRTFALVEFGVRASTKLHDSLLARVLRAPLSFFDTTPVGRIVSRFSKV